MHSRTNTRQKLVHAAVVIMDDKGPTRLRLRDVAEAVGIKEPSIYKFFESRDALIVAAGAARYARGITELAERFATFATKATTREEFHEVIRQVITASTAPERVSDRAGRVTVIGLAMSRPDLAAEIRLVQTKSNRLIAQGLRHGVERGWVRSDIPLELAAHWATSVVSGRVYLELDPNMPDANTWDDLTMHAILTLLVPKK